MSKSNSQFSNNKNFRESGNSYTNNRSSQNDVSSKYKSIENAYEHVDEVKPPNASKKLKEFYDQAAFETWQINQKIGIEVILSKVDPGLILVV